MLLLICSCKLSIIFCKMKKIDWVLSFEVLDPSITSSIISSTSQISTSTSTTSTTQGLSSPVERDLAISLGVVGTSFAILFIFLLWRICNRRKSRNGGNMNPITPQFRPVPIIPGNGTQDPLNNNLISMSDGATSPYGLGIQKYGSIIIIIPPCSHFFFFYSNNLNGPYDRGLSSYSDPPSYGRP